MKTGFFMIETKELLSFQDAAHSIPGLWEDVVSSVPGTEVRNGKELQGRVKVLVTLCPLYGYGSLQEADLIKHPQTIDQSRVLGKWTGTRAVLEVMSRHLKARKGNLDLKIIFANRGVLLNSDPKKEDEEALEYHERIYRSEVHAFCINQGINYEFLNYDNCGVLLPRFINPRTSIPEMEVNNNEHTSSGSPMVDLLNKYLEMSAIPNRIVDINKKTRKIVSDIVKTFGSETAFWLIIGYLAFDYNIPKMIGGDGVYLSAERFGALQRISNLTRELKSITRVEIAS